MTFFGPSMTEKIMVEARARKISQSSQLRWAVEGRAMHYGLRISLVYARVCEVLAN